MSSATPAEGLRHRAFEAAAACSLAAARLTDRQRLALVLQGAAVLAHLNRAGWHLPGGWDGAGVAADGTLCLPAPAPGRSRLLPQDLLRALVARLFGASEVVGRGQARRALRALASGWRQSLTAVPLTQAVAELLGEAPFLWGPAFATARRALAGEHRRQGKWRGWVAGPGGARRRLLAAARGRGELEELLGGEEARVLWQEAEEEGQRRPAAGRSREEGREGAAPAGPAAERLEQARALFARGQFGKALAALFGLKGSGARLLRARCQYRLGELAAAGKSIRSLAAVRAGLAASEILELAEVAVRVWANLGSPEEVAGWVERAREAGRDQPALRLRAEVLAANAAWDLGRGPETMRRHLDAAAAAREAPELAWRWHAAASLAAALAGAGEEAVDELRRALAAGRRRLTRFEAGELWNELGVCRARLGDLAGAERAFLHTVHLLGRCEGPRQTTLALYNLAEIRLRRGRLLGVRQILEEATLANRLAGNFRGGVQDAELWARFELAQGRALAALGHCREALGELDRRGSDWRRPVLAALAARAYGWLGRRLEAAGALAAVDAVALGELEPEELPALWAHAGEREEALRRAAGTPFAALWHGLLVEGQAPEAAWRGLAGLGPYRAARLVFDAELAAPGAAPGNHLRRAIATFRRVGAAALAEPLEARHAGPWQALASYLAGPPDGEALLALFARLGDPETSVTWTVDGHELPLIDGRGGEGELTAPFGGGRLVLRSPAVDGVLRALFALALRDLEPRHLAGAEEGVPRNGRSRAAAGGLLGESPALKAALGRLERLAPGDLPLLILGESGTGKELAARRVHRSSARAERPFVALNCAAVAESLLLSDLFGHVRGAFTGADRDRAGVFETAQGGTVFLDEIGDLPAAAQGMLLRVLQEGEVRRVGESLARKVKVRVVAATHRNLEEMVRRGSFRQDLYFRLKVAAIELPPLRERGSDVMLLADHFLARAAGGGAVPKLSAAARSALIAHPWPGNVRELENVIQVAVALAAGDGCDIGPEHLELPHHRAPSGDYHQQIDAVRRRIITAALRAAGGNQAEAARRLGLSRQALSYQVRQLKLI
jgi:DNA-binding NtrC family response regulator/tetratricopeptide (TPR) repeat protein